MENKKEEVDVSPFRVHCEREIGAGTTAKYIIYKSTKDNILGRVFVGDFADVFTAEVYIGKVLQENTWCARYLTIPENSSKYALLAFLGALDRYISFVGRESVRGHCEDAVFFDNG